MESEVDPVEDAKARPGSPTRRVCLFCERWASGGIESFLYNVLTHADLTGLEVDIVAAQLDGRSVFTKPLEELGTRFVELSGRRRAPAEDHRRFLALLETRRYDAIHLNLFQGLSLWYAKAAARAGIPVRIAHSHNTALRKSLTRPLKLALHRWGRARYGKYATHRWACAQEAARFLFGDVPFRFVPNGIDTRRFRFDPAGRETVRGELGAGEATLVLGSVGRLCYQKNQSFLLDVFAQLRRERPDSLLLLVGQGEDREDLEEKARALALSDAVIFYGVSDQVWRLLWAMDVFLLPSRFEGLPVSLVEAQAAGLPALCSQAVTREAALTQVDFLPLEPQLWARTIVNTRSADRAAAADTVAAAGFDIGEVAARVREAWMG